MTIKALDFAVHSCVTDLCKQPIETPDPIPH